MTDAELLDAYSSASGESTDTSRNEAAFGELMRRHGAMVYQACLRLLKDPHEAKDASQAVFVVLARKANRLRQGDLSAWLYRVAHLVAAETVRKRMHRSTREEIYATNEAMQVDAVEPTDEPPTEFGLLDNALMALPERYRQAVILRYLKNHSQEDAARLAGCPLGTLKWRAGEGISRMRAWLAKRGVTTTATALTALFASQASASVPETLLSSTLATVKGAAATTASVTGATSNAIALAKGAMKTMFMAKVKITAAAVAITASVILTGMAVAQAVSKDNTSKSLESAPQDPSTSPGSLVVQEGFLKESFYATGVLASPDGSCIATWNGWPTQLRIWDAKNPGLLLFAAEEDVSDLAFAPDGRRFVTLGGQNTNAIKVWSWPSCTLLRTLPTPSCHLNNARIFFVLDGDHVAANSPYAARVWDLNTGQAVKLEVRDPAIDREELEIERRKEEIVARRTEIQKRLTAELGPYGSLTADQRKKWAERRDAEMDSFFGPGVVNQFWSHVRQFGRTNKPGGCGNYWIAPALSGKTVAVVANSHQVTDPVRICDARTGKLIRLCERTQPIEPSAKQQTYVSLYSDADGVVIAEARLEKRLLILWDPTTGREIARLDGVIVMDRDKVVLFPKQNTILFQDCLKGLMSWNWTAGGEPQLVSAPKSWPMHPLDADANRLAFHDGSGNAWILDRRTGKTTNWPICESRGSSDSVSLAVERGGRFLASASRSCHVALWDLTEACMTKQTQFMRPIDNEYPTQLMEFAPKGGRLHLLYSSNTGVYPDSRTRYTFGAWTLANSAPESFLTSTHIRGETLPRGTLGATLAFYKASNGQLVPVDMHSGQSLPAIALDGLPKELSFRATLAPYSELMYVSASFITNIVSLFVDLRTGRTEPAKPENADIIVTSPDGRWRLAQCKGEGVNLFSVGDGTVQRLFGDDIGVIDLQYSATMSGEFNSDVPGEFNSWVPNDNRVTDLRFDATGRRFLVRSSHSVTVGEIGSGTTDNSGGKRGRIVRELPLERLQYRSMVRLLPGGKALVVGQTTGSLLVDVDTAEDVAVLRAFPDGAWLISTPDGLFTGSPDIESRLALVKDGKALPAEELAKRRNHVEIRKRLQPYVLDPRLPDGFPSPQ